MMRKRDSIKPESRFHLLKWENMVRDAGNHKGVI